MDYKENAKIWQGWLESIEKIPDEATRAELALVIFRYALRGIKYTGDNVYINIIMPTIEKSIDNANRNAMNGAKGGLQKAANSGANSGANSDATTQDCSTKTKDIDIDIDKRHTTKKDDFDFAGTLLAQGVPECYVNDYILIRKKKKVGNTRSALQGLVENAKKAGISLAYAVQICAQNSWQSFNPKYVEGWTLDDPYKDSSEPTQTTERLDQFGQPIVDVNLNN